MVENRSLLHHSHKIYCWLEHMVENRRLLHQSCVIYCWPEHMVDSAQKSFVSNSQHNERDVLSGVQSSQVITCREREALFIFTSRFIIPQEIKYSSEVSKACQ